ncbi:MAG: hypothetical protein VW875_11880 [Planctomycetaceae bacterium]
MKHDEDACYLEDALHLALRLFGLNGKRNLHFNSKGTASQKKAEADTAEIRKKTFFTLAGGKEGSLSEFLCEKPI